MPGGMLPMICCSCSGDICAIICVICVNCSGDIPNCWAMRARSSAGMPWKICANCAGVGCPAPPGMPGIPLGVIPCIPPGATGSLSMAKNSAVLARIASSRPVVVSTACHVKNNARENCYKKAKYDTFVK